MGKTVRFLLVQGPLLPRCDSNTRDQARSRPIGGSERLQARLGYTPPSPVCGLGQAFQGRLAPMATRPKADELSNRVATLEKRVSELTNWQTIRLVSPLFCSSDGFRLAPIASVRRGRFRATRTASDSPLSVGVGTSLVRPTRLTVGCAPFRKRRQGKTP